MFSPKLLLISAVAVALVGSTFAVSSLYASAQDNGEKVINGGHGLGYYQTTGDVLDPTGPDGAASTGVYHGSRRSTDDGSFAGRLLQRVDF